jgi:hypothetical protein
MNWRGRPSPYGAPRTYRLALQVVHQGLQRRLEVVIVRRLEAVLWFHARMFAFEREG